MDMGVGRERVLWSTQEYYTLPHENLVTAPPPP